MSEYEDDMLFLDFYDSGETDSSSIWCWKKGYYSSQEFESEDAALQALADESIVFSSLDNEDVLGALYATAEVNENLEPPFDYWLVDESAVWEPRVTGQFLGRLPDYKIAAGMKVLKLTSESFECLQAEFEHLQEVSDDT